MILIFRGSALTRRVGSLAGSQAAPARQSRGGPARALPLPPVVRTSSAPGWLPYARALAETRREFGQDYKEGAAVGTPP